jgi:ATP-dependent Clp protease ATP-binding subunit ClpB
MSRRTRLPAAPDRYGARPLRRFIAREVETRIGRALLGGNVPDGSVIKVDTQEGAIVIENTPPVDAESMP